MKKLIFILFLLLLSLTTKAQTEDSYELQKEIFDRQSDYLVPAQSLLNSDLYEIKYNRKIKEILFNGLPEYIDIQYFVTPSFEAERVLIIRKNKIYYHQAGKSIWSNYYQEINNKSNKLEKAVTIKVKKYKSNINEDDVKLIEKLYSAVLTKARHRIFTENELNNLIGGNDGSTYSFSLSNSGIKEGTTWSPDKNSKMYRLVEINNELINAVKLANETIELSVSLKNRIKKLIDETNLSDYNFEKNTISKIKDTIINHLNKNLDFKKLINMKNVSVSDDFIYTIKKGKIKRIKLQKTYHDRDLGKFSNWFNNLFEKNASKEYKKALKNLDLSYLNLELNLKVYIDLTFDNKLVLLEQY